MLYLGYDNAAHKSTSLGRCPTELPPLYGYRPPSSGRRHELNINPPPPSCHKSMAAACLPAAGWRLPCGRRIFTSTWRRVAYLRRLGHPLVACSSWLGKSYSMAACWRRSQHLTTAGYAILHLLKELF